MRVIKCTCNELLYVKTHWNGVEHYYSIHDRKGRKLEYCSGCGKGTPAHAAMIKDASDKVNWVQSDDEKDK